MCSNVSSFISSFGVIWNGMWEMIDSCSLPKIWALIGYSLTDENLLRLPRQTSKWANSNLPSQPCKNFLDLLKPNTGEWILCSHSSWKYVDKVSTFLTLPFHAFHVVVVLHPRRKEPRSKQIRPSIMRINNVGAKKIKLKIRNDSIPLLNYILKERYSDVVSW